MPDPEQDVILETDGSCIALYAVLIQHFDDDGFENRVGFFSKSFTRKEGNYITCGLEMYAFVCFVEHFRMFVLKPE